MVHVHLGRRYCGKGHLIQAFLKGICDRSYNSLLFTWCADMLLLTVNVLSLKKSYVEYEMNTLSSRCSSLWISINVFFAMSCTHQVAHFYLSSHWCLRVQANGSGHVSWTMGTLRGHVIFWGGRIYVFVYL